MEESDKMKVVGSREANSDYDDEVESKSLFYNNPSTAHRVQ